jgi:hypothetical protein
MWRRASAVAIWLLAALPAVPAHADDAHKNVPPNDPDPGFLEFLGSVDGLAEASPDYIAQTSTARGATPPPASAPKPAPPPPPPATSGAKNNE